MSLESEAIIDAVVSHAAASGHFGRVNAHEPKNAPADIACAVWLQRLEPARRSSGLHATSAVLTVTVRCYSNMLMEPQDAIDPRLMGAVDSLFAAYLGDFTLDGLVRAVDVRGSESQGLSAEYGYLSQDGRLYRVCTIALPLLVNDVWDEVA